MTQTSSLRRTYRPFWDERNFRALGARAAFFWGIAAIIGVVIILNRDGAILRTLLGEAALWGFMYAVYRPTRSGVATDRRGVDIRRYWKRRVRVGWPQISSFVVSSRSSLPPRLTVRRTDGSEIPTGITGSTDISGGQLAPVQERARSQIQEIADELNDVLLIARNGAS